MAAASVRMVMTASASRASSAGVAAAAAPAAITGCNLPAERFHTVTLCPTSMSRCAMAAPILPIPAIPICIGCALPADFPCAAAALRPRAATIRDYARARKTAPAPPRGHIELERVGGGRVASSTGNYIRSSPRGGTPRRSRRGDPVAGTQITNSEQAILDSRLRGNERTKCVGRLAMAKGKVGIVGLGIMGGAFARNLLAAGWRVVGYDVDAARRRAMARAGVEIADDAKALAAEVDTIITSLPKPAALDATVTAIVNARVRPQVIIEASTFTIDDKLKAERALRKAGHVMLDCPVSGTGAQAKVKDLVIYASGDRKAIRRLRALFAGFARAVHDLGAFGNGSR